MPADATFDFSNQAGSTYVDLSGFYSKFCKHAGGTSSLLGIAYGVTIENVIGSNGGNIIYANEADNRLIGGNGKDSLIAWGGDDHLEGRGADDILDGFFGDDWLDGGSGNDFLDGFSGFDTLLGGAGVDVLTAGDEDDYLDGGEGVDKMYGSDGNDTYVIDNAADFISEEGKADTNDRVRSSITVNLAILASGLIEHATLTVTTAVNATGNGGDNELTGNSAANKLDGGTGADTLTGGNGDDIYTVDNAGDKVVETSGGAAGGVDIVNSSLDFTLGTNVEKLTLLAGFGDIDGTGNMLNNTIVGNEGANILNGGVGNDTMTGGKGNDTMTGGKGDDTYVVNVAGDVVNETVLNSAGGGVDTVQSLVTFSLATRTNIEHLTLAGAGNINGTGNALNNEIVGNTATTS